jgi:hypothetical protein
VLLPSSAYFAMAAVARGSARSTFVPRWWRSRPPVSPSAAEPLQQPRQQPRSRCPDPAATVCASSSEEGSRASVFGEAVGSELALEARCGPRRGRCTRILPERLGVIQRTTYLRTRAKGHLIPGECRLLSSPALSLTVRERAGRSWMETMG